MKFIRQTFFIGIIFYTSIIFGFDLNSSKEYKEYIENFQSFITIHKDRTIEVKQNITYITTPANKAVHGFEYDFPTRYKDQYGNNVVVDFTVIQVLKDGKPEKYKIRSFRNGKIIRIGDPNIYLSPGSYTYTITYKTNRQLGFFEDYDEFFWNTVGTGWELPIKHVYTSVKLPENIPADSIKAKAYIGNPNQQKYDHRNYRSWIDSDGIVHFKSINTIYPRQGFSIVVIWPKGYIQPPSFIIKSYYFFKDNLAYLLLILGIIISLIYYMWIYFKKIRPTQKRSAIIPLFYPPDDLTPGAVRYINNMSYDSKVFSADIVNLAVEGFLTIDYKKSLWKDAYDLKKSDKSFEKAKESYQPILHALFKDNQKKLTLNQRYSQQIIHANRLRQDYLSYTYGSKYFELNEEYLFWGVFISLLFFIPALILMVYHYISNFSMVVLALAFIVFITLASIFSSLFKSYTKEGRKIKERIMGFKMFLATTEAERLKIIGTPPTKTPELYEEYLPYAIALGVEKQWSKQFASIFERLAKHDQQYQPIWYTGSQIHALNLINFSYNLSNSLNSTISKVTVPIASSSQVPGSSSGWGGGGGVGRGGGGGGGRSW